MASPAMRVRARPVGPRRTAAPCLRRSSRRAACTRGKTRHRKRQVRCAAVVELHGLKRLRSARVISAGHAFVQNLRRGHYEFGMDVDPRHRLPAAFAELKLTIKIQHRHSRACQQAVNATPPHRLATSWPGSSRAHSRWRPASDTRGDGPADVVKRKAPGPDYTSRRMITRCRSWTTA
jgi:hypothetical protein